MPSFALFRLPYERQCTLLMGHVEVLSSCTELTGKRGFVMAPFAVSDSHPILVIQPDVVEHYSTTSLNDLRRWPCLADVTDTNLSGVWCETGGRRADYHIDFQSFHAHLDNGDFQKLVLSRCISVPRGIQQPMELFRSACEHYPRVFIALVYTPQSGIWLTATPEILLAGKEGHWQTMALAGTTPFSDDVRWSDKNIQEQRYVATYIIEHLEQFTRNFTEEGPRTARAGHLAHLRSDFHFTLDDDTCIGRLLQALHPTPAVCGLPKQQAFSFIRTNEHHDRSYYSGFMGALFVENLTNIYVTLRCMHILPAHYELFAGGGLLRDSVEEQEWQETETKLDTMRALLIDN